MVKSSRESFEVVFLMTWPMDPPAKSPSGIMPILNKVKKSVALHLAGIIVGIFSLSGPFGFPWNNFAVFKPRKILRGVWQG